MHNLQTVINFEIIRTLKKKSFWIMALGFPIMLGAVFGIIILSNQSTSDAAADLEKQEFSIQITDNSGLLRPDLLTVFGVTKVADRATGRDNVVRGEVDAYFYYPRDIAKNNIEIYAKDVGLFDNGRYEAVAQSLLTASVQTDMPADVLAVARGGISTQTTTFRDDQVYDPFKQMIFPAVFLVLFYLLIAFFGNQMLTSTTEEKENRVIEMLLTTVQARTLIIGKIISLIILSIVQGLIIVLPALIGYLLLHDRLQMPAFDLSSIPVDPVRITVSAAIFVASFLLFTGLLVAIGASVPTAKEAGGFIGIVMMLIFGPLYAASLFISNPDSPLVKFLTLFPFTAPIPMMLRNAVGNLEWWEIIVGIILLIISGTIVMAIAVRVFRYGALEYSRKLSLKEIFGRS
ncbi:ABC transporter permease [Candidatus Saccharibacteria bacterium]|nr:ABC transporter permease [Candidatus Saccharibacteria bacterium]